MEQERAFEQFFTITCIPVDTIRDFGERGFDSSILFLRLFFPLVYEGFWLLDEKFGVYLLCKNGGGNAIASVKGKARERGERGERDKTRKKQRLIVCRVYGGPVSNKARPPRSGGWRLHPTRSPPLTTSFSSFYTSPSIFVIFCFHYFLSSFIFFIFNFEEYHFFWFFIFISIVIFEEYLFFWLMLNECLKICVQYGQNSRRILDL